MLYFITRQACSVTVTVLLGAASGPNSGSASGQNSGPASGPNSGSAFDPGS